MVIFSKKFMSGEKKGSTHRRHLFFGMRFHRVLTTCQTTLEVEAVADNDGSVSGRWD